VTKSKLIKTLANRKTISTEIVRLSRQRLTIDTKLEKLINLLEEIKSLILIDEVVIVIIESIDGFRLSSYDEKISRWCFLESCGSKYIVKYFTGKSERFRTSTKMNKKQALSYGTKWIQMGHTG
jgi:hypothetical protein